MMWGKSTCRMALPVVCCVQVDTCDKSSRYSDISQKGKHRRPEQCEQHPGSMNLDCVPCLTCVRGRKKEKRAWLGIEPRTSWKLYTQISKPRIMRLDHQAVKRAWMVGFKEGKFTWHKVKLVAVPRRWNIAYNNYRPQVWSIRSDYGLRSIQQQDALAEKLMGFS